LVEQAAGVPSSQIRAAVLVVAAGCSGTAESQPSFSQPPSVPTSEHEVAIAEASRPYISTQSVALQAGVSVVRAPARVAFRDGAVSQINLPVPGRVTAVHVKTGDRVKVGDPLLTLVSPEAASARALLATAAAHTEAARKELARQDQMAGSGVGIESERVAAQAALREAEAELARAQATAGMLGSGGGSTIVLRAPIDATVLSRRATVGTAAEPGGEPLIELGNPAALWVVADVFDRDLALVHEGADVDVEIAAGDAPLHGHIASVGTALTNGLRTAPVYVDLATETSGSLRAGMFARATIKAAADQSIVLPAEAVLVKDGKRYVVYVRKSGDRYTARDVTVGRSVDGQVQVLSGLQIGEQVVVKGALLLDNSAEQLL
jgi:cobalt-zinc-cadmium efflux system membrane fusion protein